MPNPVNPEENFADRWGSSGPIGRRAFFRWLEVVNTDLAAAADAATDVVEAA